MGRICNNLVVKAFTYLLCCFLFWRCTAPPPEFAEMVGTWKAKDGSVIELNSDGYFIIKDLNSSFLVHTQDARNIPLDAYGTWEIREQPDLGRILLSLNIYFAIKSSDSLYLSSEEKYFVSKYGTYLYIKDKNIVPTNNPKWFIRGIDNPWDYNSCDFYKVEEEYNICVQ